MHTPGTWHKEVRHIVARDAYGNSLNGGHSVAKVYGDDSDDNARLIAAAPNLLAACERTEQTIRNLGNGFLTGEAQEIALNEAANLRAAISKAKGE